MLIHIVPRWEALSRHLLPLTGLLLCWLLFDVIPYSLWGSLVYTFACRAGAVQPLADAPPVDNG